MVLKLQMVQTMSSCLHVAIGSWDWEATRSLCKEVDPPQRAKPAPIPHTFYLDILAEHTITVPACYVAWHPAKVGSHPGVTLG